MKVCYITMQFPAPSETFAATDIHALRRAGTQVSVYSLRPAHKDVFRLLAERNLTDIEITHYTINSLFRALAGIISSPVLLFSLIMWILRYNYKKPNDVLRSFILLLRVIEVFDDVKRKRPDIVHLFWGHYPSMVAHLVQTYLPDIAVSMFLGAYDLEMRYGGSAPVARRADVVWTHAKMNIKDIEKMGVSRERIVVAYRGIDLSHIRGKNTSSEKIKRRIVTAGRLSPFKGTDDVLRVFNGVLKHWPDASLVVLGDGSERKRLHTLVRTLGIEKSVEFHGHVSHEKVFAAMRCAEVFILMSTETTERLPNVIKEAMSCRALCITSESPGIEELLENGKHGYIVAKKDVDGAIRYISEVFLDIYKMEDMTMAAYQHLEEKFDVEHTMARYGDIWKLLLSRRGKSGGQKIV